MMVKRVLRIRYSKIGLMRFIGHLDMTHIITRSIARSSIPVIYSQGFSPHMKVSFGPSLPLGVTGENEYVDVQIDEAESMNTPEEWRDELQGFMPEGVGIKELGVLEEDAVSLAESIDRAAWRIAIPQEFAPSNEKLARFLQNENIHVQKKSKKGVKEIDIRPSIERFERVDDASGCAEVVVYELVTKIATTASATPALVLKVFLECDWWMVPGLRITRKKLYSSAERV